MAINIYIYTPSTAGNILCPYGLKLYPAKKYVKQPLLLCIVAKKNAVKSVDTLEKNVLMLTHRLPRWANINPTLGQRLVLAGYW